MNSSSRVLVVAIVLAAGSLLACGANDSKTQSGNSAGDIAIAGTWLLSNVNVNTGKSPGSESMRMSIDNSTYSGVYLPSGATNEGTIEEYDNATGIYIVHVTRDDRYPESAGIFDKCGWSLPAPDRMIMTAYAGKGSLAEAKACTTVTWGPSDPFVKQ